MQLWNNRDETEVTTKLTTVSYGGLKEDNGDVTMACLTAIVGDVHLENELIAAGVVYLSNKFILVGSYIFDATSIALEEYYESLPELPYYSSPKMPVVGDYDTTLMGEDTVPLQYIKMPADEHISTYYLGTKIGDDSDLEDLYEETAKFFSAGSDTFDDPTSTAAIVSPFGIVLTVAGAERRESESSLMDRCDTASCLFGTLLRPKRPVRYSELVACGRAVPRPPHPPLHPFFCCRRDLEIIKIICFVISGRCIKNPEVFGRKARPIA
eukprot:scaffold3284_cov103-Skeletonema_marinoi.AAC.2